MACLEGVGVVDGAGFTTLWEGWSLCPGSHSCAGFPWRVPRVSSRHGGAFRLGAGLVTGAPYPYEILMTYQAALARGGSGREHALIAVLGADTWLPLQGRQCSGKSQPGRQRDCPTNQHPQQGPCSQE
jgi:hypothetical protein